MSRVQIDLLYPAQPPRIEGGMVTIQTALLERRRTGHWLIELIWR